MTKYTKVCVWAFGTLVWLAGARMAQGKTVTGCTSIELDRMATVNVTVLAEKPQIGTRAYSAYAAYKALVQAIHSDSQVTTSRSELRVVATHFLDLPDTCDPHQLLETQLARLSIGQSAIVVTASFVDGDVDTLVTLAVYFSHKQPREDLEARGRQFDSAPHDVEVFAKKWRLLGRLSADYARFGEQSLMGADYDVQLQQLPGWAFLKGLIDYLDLTRPDVDGDRMQKLRLLERSMESLGTEPPPGSADQVRMSPSMARALALEMVGIARVFVRNDDEGALSKAVQTLPRDVDARNLEVIAGLARWNSDASAKYDTKELIDAASRLKSLLDQEPLNEILLINESRLITAIKSESPALAPDLVAQESEIRRRLVDTDTRGNSELSPFVGLNAETLAVYNLGAYVNPDQAGTTKTHGAVGVFFTQRIVGDPVRNASWKNPQIWLGSRFQLGSLSTDTDCVLSSVSRACVADPKSGPIFSIVSHATDVEAAVSAAWEFFSLRPNSGLGSNIYVKGEAGFLAIANSGSGVAGDHSLSFGLVLTNGALSGSYFQFGVGTNDLLQGTHGRWKTDAYVSFNRLPMGVRPFLQLKTDLGRLGGTDSIQFLVGVSIALVKLTSVR